MFEFLAEKFSSAFSRLTGKPHLSAADLEGALQKIREALLDADVPYELADSFLASVQEELVGKQLHASLKPGEQVVKLMHERLTQFLGGGSDAAFSFQLPATVMVMGLQGAGKTTLIAKLAHYVQEQAKMRGKKRSILVASVDFSRPAAIDQLELLAKQAEVSFYRSSKTDPIAAAHDIMSYRRQHSFEVLFLDTAGRLQTAQALLEELKALDAVLKPSYKILVLDAMTGQQSLRVAQEFDRALCFGYGVLTKMDSQTRGGAAFAFRYALKKPLIFVGTGEKLGDLEQFRPDRMAGRIIGMGDVRTLIEKAETSLKQADQEKVARSMMQADLTLQDFADQLKMVGSLGSLANIASYLPGLSGTAVTPEALNKGEAELKKYSAILSSMTHKERVYPKILNHSRKQRIAKGAGVSVADISSLLRRFEETQQFAKLFKKFGRLNPFGKSSLKDLFK